MQVAAVSTEHASVRSTIDGWTFEDASLFVPKTHPSSQHTIFIGYTPAPKHIPTYGTILEMLADGWKLLGPPTQQSLELANGDPHVSYEWWLTRDRQEGSAP